MTEKALLIEKGACNRPLELTDHRYHAFPSDDQEEICDHKKTVAHTRNGFMTTGHVC